MKRLGFGYGLNIIILPSSLFLCTKKLIIFNIISFLLVLLIVISFLKLLFPNIKMVVYKIYNTLYISFIISNEKLIILYSNIFKKIFIKSL